MNRFSSAHLAGGRSITHKILSRKCCLYSYFTELQINLLRLSCGIIFYVPNEKFKNAYKYYIFRHYQSSGLYLKTPSYFFLKTQRFGVWIVSPSSIKTYSFGPNRASPYLQRFKINAKYCKENPKSVLPRVRVFYFIRQNKLFILTLLLDIRTPITIHTHSEMHTS